MGTLKDRTQQLYIVALRNLDAEIQDTGLTWQSLSLVEQDEALAEILYDRMCRSENLQYSQYMVSALKKIVPNMSLTNASAVLAAWRHGIPPKQAPACAAVVARALATLALLLAQPGVAFVITVCFFGLLRVSEGLSLTVKDVHFLGSVCIITLSRSKRGVNEKVTIHNAEAIAWLQHYVKSLLPKSGKCKGAYSDTLAGTSYSKFRYWLVKLQSLLGISALALTSHSFRRGGASTLLADGWSMANIAIMGRWASESSCRLYVRQGEMFLVKAASENLGGTRVTLFSKCYRIAWELGD